MHRFCVLNEVYEFASKSIPSQGDTNNQRIRYIDLASGLVTTLAGSGSVGTVDGVGSYAQFYDPTGVAINALGTFAIIVSSHI